MSPSRSIYRVVRSVIFTTLIIFATLIVGLYVALSIPAVQKSIKTEAEKALTEFLGSRVAISELIIRPFNEVELFGVVIYTPEAEKCISIGKLGAGINLWTLISERKIELAYAELISLNAAVSQYEKDGPLNIDFIIKALSPKDQKNKTQIELKLRNIVIRKSSLTFDKLYEPKITDPSRFDPNHIAITDLRADLALPLIMKDDYTVDLRRLGMKEKSGFTVSNLSFFAHITPGEIDIKNFKFKSAESSLTLSDLQLPIKGFHKIKESLLNHEYSLTVNASPLVPSDFAAFLPRLKDFKDKYQLSMAGEGTIDFIKINQFNLTNPSNSVDVEMIAELANLAEPDRMEVNLNKLDASISSDFISSLLQVIIPGKDKIYQIASKAGNINLNCEGKLSLNDKKSIVFLELASNLGNIGLEGGLMWKDKNIDITNFKTNIENLSLGTILDNAAFGSASANIEGNCRIAGKDVMGDIKLDVPYFDFNSHRFENIYLEAFKTNKDFKADAKIVDELINLDLDISALLDGDNSKYDVDLNIERFLTSAIIANHKMSGTDISGNIYANFSGNSPDNLDGQLKIDNLDVKGKKDFHFNEITLNITNDNHYREFNLHSDLIDGSLRGDFIPSHVFKNIKNLISQSIPAIIKSNEGIFEAGQYAELLLTIKPKDKFYSNLNLPVRWPVPVTINATYNGDERNLDLSLDAPYLIQGKNKLIKSTSLIASVRADSDDSVTVRTTFPIKNNYADLTVDLSAFNNHITGDISWEMQNNIENRGLISLWADIYKNLSTSSIEIEMGTNPSSFTMQGAEWKISESAISYGNKNLNVDNLLIHHGTQFIDIKGRASENPLDVLGVELAGIDLEYIFNILNINHVDFGGIASGKAHVSQLFSKNPIAMTDHLFVKDLAYNQCVFGDGNIEGHWDNLKKMVAINADIESDHGSSATVKGEIYVTRDSLSFDFGANKVDVAFLKPFVENFTSRIGGIASGKVKMYGTFSDIDLKGMAFTDSVSMLVDYTNVTYTARDTVYFSPGMISFPNMHVKDRFGNTCILDGNVTHDFLRNASFTFDAKQIDNMLVYDTGPNSVNNWYGTVFGNGDASIKGRPGYIDISINLSTSKNSVFTLVLDDNQTAANYSFLTFSDRNKPIEEEINVQERFEAELIHKKPETEEEEIPDIFAFDLLLDMTPEARMIIVMDPKAGDKISAHGRGALQMHYDSETDRFNMYGKYSLVDGNYNFSLQELILKNFSIREGSTITFNGDPLRGILDITAAYRVNTNLADLDESFKSDPDLNRTSVPVDALLKVTGELDAPEINFDLDFPTVTADVQRRVRSIVSTEDMMNQQMIYLLALNRFYSPEYTSSQQGGELASVASSTISSQIQNIIGSLTDKFSLAPSFKSEKDNFSDMEVDVALSSKLFDDRLLLNGNLGYRDKSTSQTTFIGDFDLEYLLSKDGKLRLKAYNHFNDASYYLKSALTTQGIGVVYRKEFNDPFKFLKRLFRRRRQQDSVKKD